ESFSSLQTCVLEGRTHLHGSTYSGSWERDAIEGQARISLDTCFGGLSNDLVRQLPVVITSGTTRSGKLEPVTVKENLTSPIAATCMSGSQMHGKRRSCMAVTVESTK
ncbi:unnamed protein product, partial [Ectocarpus sp. 12 AP-2014]